jgi:DNA-binding PucR family transcriptional regulator
MPLNSTQPSPGKVIVDHLAAAVACGREYLALLGREAPAADFERPLEAARKAGLPEERLAELDAARRLALRVRDGLDQHRRREAELAALFETASDLAALHDLDAVLEAIVRRARTLIGTDVAYMTLNDPARGDTYMRVTSGSVSARFQQVRLGLGEGLGGLVAATGTAYVTSLYLADERFRHTSPIDNAVTDEGLVAILGVPLLLGKSVIGVLFAADRRPRTFGPAEVSLLASLAAHAAVAIDAANLLEEAQTAAADLNAANKRLSEQRAAVERTSQAHRRFTELVLAGGNAEDIARGVADVLGRGVVILGADDTPLALSAESLPPEPKLRNAATAARAAGRAVQAGPLWTVPATGGPEHLGTLILQAGPELAETDRLILERAAMVTALLLLLRRSATEAEHRVRGELLGDLLTAARQDMAALRDRARRLGAELDRPHVLVVATAPRAQRAMFSSAAAHLAATRHGLAAEHEGTMVLLVPGTDPAAMAREISAALAGAARQPVTTAAAASGEPTGISAAYAEARRCLDALITLGRSGETAIPGDLGFLGLLLSDRKDVPGFISAAIGPVVDYDARRGTGLLRTLEAYFAASGNLTKTKDALHVHVNTVTQRLDRITRLVGDGWQSGERALEIRVAIRLYRAGAQNWSS